MTLLAQILLKQAAWLFAGMLDTLQDIMVQDKDAQVVANCMSVLKQVWWHSSQASAAGTL